MKKGLLVSLAALLSLGLVACGGTDLPSSSSDSSSSSSSSSSDGSSSSSSSSGSSSGGSSSSSQSGSQWSSTIQGYMNQVVGEVLPYVEFNSSIQASVESDDDGDYIYIYENSGNTDKCSAFGDVYVAAGFEYTSSDDSYGYDVFFYEKVSGDNDIIVQFDYFPGNEEYNAGMEMYAWLNVETPKEYITDWDADTKTLMNTYLKELLPIEDEIFTTDTEVEYDEEYECVAVYDSLGDSSTITSYGNCLTANGYTALTGDDEGLFTKDVADSKYYLSVAVYEVTLFGYSFGVEVDATYAMKPVTTTTWPSDAVSSFLGDTYTRSYPPFTSTSYSYYYSSSTFVIQGAVSEADFASYKASLIAQSYVYSEIDEDGDDIVDYYYFNDFLEQANVYLVYADGSLTCQISLVEKAYKSIVTAFPTDEVVSYLGEGKTAVPSYTSSQYKVTVADEYLLICSIDNGTPGTDAIEDSYKTALTAASWSVDDSDYKESGYIAKSAAMDVQLTFFTYNGLFCLYVQPIEAAEGGVFDFSTEDQLSTKNATKSVWTAGDISMTVEKSSSTLDVGNGSFFSNPLRVYTNQVLTIIPDEVTMSSIQFECKNAEYASVLAGSTWTNATASVDSSNSLLVNVTPTDGTANVSVTLSAKVFMTSLTVIYA